MLLAVALSVACVVVSVLVQFEVVGWLWRLNDRKGPRIRARVALSVSALIGLHLFDIVVFGFGYIIGERLFELGAVTASRPIGVMDVFYYSAEVFSTLGLGDIYATSYLRMLTSIEALSGVLLLSWSASFIVVAVQRTGDGGDDPRP